MPDEPKPEVDMMDFLGDSDEPTTQVEAEGQKDGGEPQAQTTQEEPNEIEILRAQVAQLSSALNERQQQADISSAPQQVEIEPIEFVTEESFTEALTDHTKFNELLNKAFLSGVNASRKLILQDMPNIVNPMTQTVLAQQKMVNDFYSANPELNDKRDFVKFVALELAKQNKNTPDYTIDKMLTDLASETKKRLGIGGKQPKKEATFAGTSTGARRPSNREVSDVEQDVLDLLGD